MLIPKIAFQCDTITLLFAQTKFYPRQTSHLINEWVGDYFAGRRGSSDGYVQGFVRRLQLSREELW